MKYCKLAFRVFFLLMLMAIATKLEAAVIFTQRSVPTTLTTLPARSAALEQVRHQWLLGNGSIARDMARKMCAADPSNLAIAGWYVMLSGRGNGIQDLFFTHTELLPIVQTMKAQAPDDPWTLLAGASTGLPRNIPKQAQLAVDKSSGDPDILVFATDLIIAYGHNYARRSAEMETFWEKNKAAFAVTSETLAKEVDLGHAILIDPTMHSDAFTQTLYALTEQAYVGNPRSIAAIEAKAAELAEQHKNEECFGLIKDAQTSVPDSYSLHLLWWNLVHTRAGLSDKERESIINEDAVLLLERVQPSASIVMSIIPQFSARLDPSDTDALEDLILRLYPHSPAEQAVRYDRLLLAASEQERMAKIKGLEGLQDEPSLFPEIEHAVDTLLIHELTAQGDTDLNRLLKTIVKLNGAGRETPDSVMLLAKRKVNLSALEAFVVHKVSSLWGDFYTQLGGYSQDGLRTMALRYIREDAESWQEALGAVYVAEGKLDIAQHSFDLAATMVDRDMVPTNAAHRLPINLGHLYEARGEPAKAGQEYRESLGQPYYGMGDHPAVLALHDLYLRTHGNDTRNLEAYLAPILKQDGERRRRIVLEKRNPVDREIEPFSLKDLKGNTVTLTSLKGKVVVVDYWATWCHWCTVEFPEFKKFIDKYKSIPNVAIVTISVDEPDTTNSMVEHVLTSRNIDGIALRGLEYATKSKVYTFPTAWFLNPEGKLAFEVSGSSKHLVEEFSWRVDALLAKTSDTFAPAHEQ